MSTHAATEISGVDAIAAERARHQTDDGYTREYDAHPRPPPLQRRQRDLQRDQRTAGVAVVALHERPFGGVTEVREPEHRSDRPGAVPQRNFSPGGHPPARRTAGPAVRQQPDRPLDAPGGLG